MSNTQIFAAALFCIWACGMLGSLVYVIYKISKFTMSECSNYCRYAQWPDGKYRCVQCGVILKENNVLSSERIEYIKQVTKKALAEVVKDE